MSEEKKIQESQKGQGTGHKPQAASEKEQSAVSSQQSSSIEEKPANSSLEAETSNIKLQTSNLKPETENMEVHKHPHHVTHKKKWGEYFLEFFMIFLAITLGFIAENIREHSVEKQNAKRYLETYRDELLQQKKLFTDYKKLYQNKIVNSDSVKMIIYNHEENQKLDVLERLLIPVLTLIEVPFNTASYDQMVNAGALRYIHNIELRDSMSAYKGYIENTRAYNTRMLQSMVANTFEISKLQDFHDVVSADTSLSYNLTNHVPDIKPFASLTEEQRRVLIFFYESYIVQAQSDLRRLRILEVSNQNLLNMVNAQLKK